jgi:uncharacterized protein YkwD
MRSFFLRLQLFLLPSSQNDWRPYSLRPRAVLFYIFLALAIKALSFFFVVTLPKTSLFADISSQMIVTLTNDARIANGLEPLVGNQTLDRVARQRAEDMLAYHYFSHTSPEGREPWYWFSENGYSFQYAGENLAIDFLDSSEVINAWLSSQTHRKNLLSENYTEIGVAVVNGKVDRERETTLVVQLFAKPKRIAKPTPPLQPQLSAKEGTLVSRLGDAPAESGEELGAATKTIAEVREWFSQTPEPANRFLSIFLKPRYLYLALLAYLSLITVLALFSKLYTPRAEVVVGSLVAFAIVILFAQWPDPVSVFEWRIRLN